MEHSIDIGEPMEQAYTFIAAIKNAIENGYGFVPFIGAGFSAPSGVPLIFEIGEYLQKCICISLGVDGAGVVDDEIEPWNPRLDQWPPLLDQSRAYTWGHWPNIMFHHIQHLRTVIKETTDDTIKYELESRIKILAEGYGAMQEWRASLYFLSRVTRDSRTAPNRSKDVHLGVPRQEVVDACFRHVLKDKQPSLAQRMLAALSGAMRIDTILTLNFDSLIEQAFEETRNTLRVFEVPTESHLPDWPAVSTERSIIKLHGGKTSIKVDYSLDEAPSEEDKKTFARYLIGSSPITNINSTGNLEFQSHLFISGFSGTDLRIKEMIKYALDKLTNSFQVFWICYSQKDFDNITKFAEDCKRTSQFHVIRYPNIGLLLLYLYQHIRKTVPPVGGIFPSISRTAIPPIEPQIITDELAKSKVEVEGFLDKATQYIAERERASAIQSSQSYPGIILASPRQIIPTLPNYVSGITSVCARLYRRLERTHNCLWIDMNDVDSAENLYEVLLESIYYKLGREDWIPSAVHVGDNPKTDDYWTKQHEELDRLLRSVNKYWVVFLNTYEVPGANSKSSDEQNWLHPAKNPDQPKPYTDQTNTPDALFRLLKGICGLYSRLSVVVLDDTNPFLPAYGVEIENVEIDKYVHKIKFFGNKHDECFFDKDKITQACLSWAESPQKLRFLAMLVLMQRPRHHSTIWNVPLGGDDHSTENEKSAWVDELEGLKLLRRKPGGLIWLHSLCRQQLRDRLFGQESLLEKHNIICDAFLPQQHRFIAEWYERILDSSESPPAAFEAAYHFSQAALAYASQVSTPSQRNSSHPYDQACANLDAACAILRSNSFMIQTKGYSRGSCRRIEAIAMGTSALLDKLKEDDLQKAFDTHLLRSIAAIWVVCAELARAIAREVGEDAKGYYRHRKAGRLLLLQRLIVQMDKTFDPDVFNRPKWVWHSEDDFKKTNLSARIREPFEVSKESKEQCPTSEYIRWCRWSCMLGIASRSFDASDRVFTTILGQLNEQNFDETHKNRLYFENQRQRIEVLRMIEQWVEMLLLRAGINIRIKNSRPSPLDEIHLLQRLIDRGLRLAARIRDLDGSADASKTIQANWCETRLLMHLSIAKTFCADETSSVPYEEAMGILSNAEAKLRLSDYRRVNSEMALIDLHRSEIKLRQAENLAINDAGGKIQSEIQELINTCKDVREGRRINTTKYGVINKNITTIQKRAQNKLQAVSAIVTDALRFLNRAAPIISQRRRNVWWATWYFERRIRVIALQVEVALLSNLQVIPFLGLEYAVRNSDTEADIILDDAIRMIRVDSYRLASIVEQYYRCFNALQCRMAVEGIRREDSNLTLGLPRRRGKMLLKLKRASQALELVNLRRIKDPQEKRTDYYYGNEEDNKVCQEAQDYVDNVIRMINSDLKKQAKKLNDYCIMLIGEELVAVLLNISEQKNVQDIKNDIKLKGCSKIIEEKKVSSEYLASRIGLTLKEIEAVLADGASQH